MEITIRDVEIRDFDRCIEIRGMTRDNPLPASLLRELGVTKEAWGPLIQNKTIVGVVAESGGDVVGFCSGDTTTGEVLVLALLPDYDRQGLGKRMLAQVMEKLFAFGYDQLWLAASADPAIRAHGFYRHLGWVPTGETQENGDEVLVYSRP